MRVYLPEEGLPEDLPEDHCLPELSLLNMVHTVAPLFLSRLSHLLVWTGTCPST